MDNFNKKSTLQYLKHYIGEQRADQIKLRASPDYVIETASQPERHLYNQIYDPKIDCGKLKIYPLNQQIKIEPDVFGANGSGDFGERKIDGIIRKFHSDFSDSDWITSFEPEEFLQNPEYGKLGKIGDPANYFMVVICYPKDFQTSNFDLILDFQSDAEALVFNADKVRANNCPIVAFTPEKDNNFVPTPINLDLLGRPQWLLFEVPNMGMFGQGYDPNKIISFEIKEFKLVARNKKNYQKVIRLEALVQIADQLKNTQLGDEALFTAYNMTLPHDDSEKYTGEDFFRRNTGNPNRDVLHSMGHAHIDSAWLWRYYDSVGKCARSWGNIVALMETDPEMTFMCSQAQQFEWIQNQYPSLFQKMKKFYHQGRFMPVGGSWVEMDGNLPSGESMIRQFLYGQKYFQKEFGYTCPEFWLPDTFGYSAQFPQILKLCGIKYFLTQKMSWNSVNKFPYNTFYWSGLDNTEVLSHFPPGDCYHMEHTVDEYLLSQKNMTTSCSGHTKIAAFLYGYGDGGGGPHQRMLDRAKILQDIDRLPKVVNSTSEKMFQAIEQEQASEILAPLNTWQGELFLEKHNGTYTAQAEIKKWNRYLEAKFNLVEYLWADKLIQTRNRDFDQFQLEVDSYHDLSKPVLDSCWKDFLLNQFHDVLPGSCTKEVVRDAIDIAQDVDQKLDSLISQIDPTFNLLDIGDYASRNLNSESENFSYTYELDEMGRISALNFPTLQGCWQNLTVEGLNFYSISEDQPLFWNAWDTQDYDLNTQKNLLNAQKIGANKFEIKQPDFTITYEYIFKPKYIEVKNQVTWNAKHKFLKVGFNTSFNHGGEAIYDIQFGHVKRKTTNNTSWESAQYEVWQHKWMALKEPGEGGVGLAIINDCKYGSSVRGNDLFLSLLRAPSQPDNTCDIGTHEFTYRILPFTSLTEVIHSGYDLWKSKLHPTKGMPNFVGHPMLDSVVLESIKVAESDADFGIIVRMYESLGRSAQISYLIFEELGFQKGKYEIEPVNCLEEPLEDNLYAEERLTQFQPFEIKTFLIEFLE